MRWPKHVARIGGGSDAYRVLVGKSEGERPFGSPRRRWEDNIKIDLQEAEVHSVLTINPDILTVQVLCKYVCR
jgi:hypothetical protein